VARALQSVNNPVQCDSVEDIWLRWRVTCGMWCNEPVCCEIAEEADLSCFGRVGQNESEHCSNGDDIVYFIASLNNGATRFRLC